MRAIRDVPHVSDPLRERAVQDACRTLARNRAIESAHDCSDGGIAVALAECCAHVGASVRALAGGRLDEALFGEAASRILISYDPRRRGEVAAAAGEAGAPVHVLGTTGGTHLSIGGALRVEIESIRRAVEGGFREIVEA